MLTAWCDEIGSIPERDPGTYLIAAALIDESAVPAVRKALDDLRLGTEVKAHWHGSSSERREALAARISELPIVGVVVVHSQHDARDRRGRRKCLEYLLPNLAEMPCSTVTFESRGHQDRSDVDLLQKFRARKIIGAGLRIDHVIGRNEPVLWAADIVAGAVVQRRVGEPKFWKPLQASIDIIEL